MLNLAYMKLVSNVRSWDRDGKKVGWLGREPGCDPKEATKRVEMNQREEEITKIKEEMSKQINERVKEGTDSRNFS